MNRNYYIVKKQKKEGSFLQLKYGNCLLKEIQVRDKPEVAQGYLEDGASLLTLQVAPQPSEGLMEGYVNAGWEPQTATEVFRKRTTGTPLYATE